MISLHTPGEVRLPNGARQARLEAGATQERTLGAVACRPLRLLEIVCKSGQETNRRLW
jgi:hypothetical protein